MSFPECDALDLLQVLEALHLCTQVRDCFVTHCSSEKLPFWIEPQHPFCLYILFYCLIVLWINENNGIAHHIIPSLTLVLQCDNDGEIEYEFPCFNQVETLDGLWEKADPRYTDGVYGGVRLRSPAPTQYILPPIYIRLQVCHTFKPHLHALPA